MNISDPFTYAARYCPDKCALIYDDKSYTYGEINRMINGVANFLHNLGLARGDRVAVYMANRPEWILLYYGAARIGAIPACIAGAYKQKEAKEVVNDSRSSILLTSETHAEQIPDRSDIPFVKTIITIESNEDLQSILRGEGKDPIPLTTNTIGEDPGSILYTGGTTGSPKGAVLTHRNIVYSAQNVAYHERLVPDDVGVCFMPLNHVFAQCHIMNTYFSNYATLVLFQAFDMDKVVSAIAQHQVTRFYAVPTIYIRILNAPETVQKLTSLRYAFSGGTSMPSETVRQWIEAFGIPIHEAYGMTESASCVTFNHLFHHKIGSIGTPAGIVEVKVVDSNDNEVKQGDQGEIVVRGPNIMQGYFGQPEETDAAMRNGWFHSGDVGLFDNEGYLYLIDRIKDIIITGGENVYPKEVEDLLHEHKAVNECGVVGLPHDEYGEAVTAFVTLKPDMTADESDLIAFCKERIANYKVPKTIRFVADLPKSPQGKILRRALRK